MRHRIAEFCGASHRMRHRNYALRLGRVRSFFSPSHSIDPQLVQPRHRRPSPPCSLVAHIPAPTPARLLRPSPPSTNPAPRPHAQPQGRSAPPRGTRPRAAADEEDHRPSLRDTGDDLYTALDDLSSLPSRGASPLPFLPPLPKPCTQGVC